jgi:hypothetical protein
MYLFIFIYYFALSSPVYDFQARGNVMAHSQDILNRSDLAFAFADPSITPPADSSAINTPVHGTDYRNVIDLSDETSALAILGTDGHDILTGVQVGEPPPPRSPKPHEGPSAPTIWSDVSHRELQHGANRCPGERVRYARGPRLQDQRRRT